MKKLLILSLSIILSSSFLIGCGISTENLKEDSKIQAEESSKVSNEVEEIKEAKSINIEEINLKSLTEEKFSDFDNLTEIITAAQEHEKRLVSSNEVIGESFSNSSIGDYKRGAIDSERNFVVDFTNNDDKSSLKTIATEFAISTTDKNCGNKIVIHFNVDKEKGLILNENEVKVIKSLIPELEKEDIKKQLNDIVKKSLKESNSYNYDFVVEEPKALFLESEPANENAKDLVIKLVYWGNYNYV